MASQASIDYSSMTDTCVQYDELLESSMWTHNFNATSVYGRNPETNLLVRAYLQVLHAQRSRTVVVHGVSGSGKTALVNTLREAVCAGQGYFVTGKYFQNLEVQEPYSAIMAAFSDLCDFVIQSDDFHERRQEIQEALGPDGQLLNKVITNLSPFLGGGSRDGRVDVDLLNEASFVQFKVACKTFLRAISSAKHPIVMFIDDIQWMDEGSRLLIELFLQDKELKSVLLIFAYRDEEASQVGTLFGQESQQELLVDIALSNLDASAVCQIVSSALGSNSEDIRELSTLIAKRTLGNPFYVVEFMDTIQREGLVQMDNDGRSCSFDVDEIQSVVMVADSLADLLSRRIKRLNPEIKEVLKVASLVGYRFGEPVVVKVASIGMDQLETNQPVHETLEDAVKEGFVEKTKQGYQFTHDRLQAAFQSMISDREEEQLHLLIGEAYLAQGSDPVNSFNAAVHLNCESGLLPGGQEKANLARINLEGSKYCAQRSAFGTAATMLQKGLAVLDQETKWSDHFDLVFELTESLARMQLIVGDFEACKETTREALSHGKTVETKINSLLIDVEVRMAAIEVEAALASASHALKTLGVNMPQKLSYGHVALKLWKIKRMLRHKTDEDILSLPTMVNQSMSAAIKLLIHVCSHSLMNASIKQGVYSALLAAELTLRFGLSPYSATSLAVYGMTEVMLGNYDKAYRFGELALTLLQRIECRAVECLTVITARKICMFRKEPLQAIPGPLLRAAELGFEIGEMAYTPLCLSLYHTIEITLGKNLQVHEKSLRASYGRISDLGHQRSLLWLQPAFQCVLNLQSTSSNWEDVASLNGSIMQEAKHMQDTKETGLESLLIIALLLRAQLAGFFGFPSLAASILRDVESNRAAPRMTDSAIPWYWNTGYVHYDLFRTTGKRRHLRIARMYKKRLEKFEALGSSTASIYVAFLAAEEISVRTSTDDATLIATYNRGIEIAAEDCHFHVEGFLSERAGLACARRQRYIEAERYFQRAMYLYKNEWGAVAMHHQLQCKSALILQAIPDTSENAHIFPYGTCITVRAPESESRRSGTCHTPSPTPWMNR